MLNNCYKIYISIFDIEKKKEGGRRREREIRLIKIQQKIYKLEVGHVTSDISYTEDTKKCRDAILKELIYWHEGAKIRLSNIDHAHLEVGQRAENSFKRFQDITDIYWNLNRYTRTWYQTIPATVLRNIYLQQIAICLIKYLE